MDCSSHCIEGEGGTPSKYPDEGAFAAASLAELLELELSQGLDEGHCADGSWEEWAEDVAGSDSELSSGSSDQSLEIVNEQFNTNRVRSKKQLNNNQRKMIVHILLGKMKDNGLAKGAITDMAKQYNVSRQTMSSLWNSAYKQLGSGQPIDVRNKHDGKKGKKRIHVNLAALEKIPMHQRRSIRALAKALDISRSSVHRLVKTGIIRAHTNAIKPFLTKENMKKRIQWCLSYLQPYSDEDEQFHDFFDHIHIDEKWFNLSNVSDRVYLGNTEKEPYRSCKSKKFITKVMFLCVVARPIFGLNGEVLFDGKIGIWPFVTIEPAKRKSKNRPAGTLETKPIQAVTKQVYRDALINKVLPAIKAKWPAFGTKNIYIQQDNARPHIGSTDTEFMAAAFDDTHDIQLVNQPANSPDLNVLDLGFFRAIQSLKEESACTTIDELNEAVTNAFYQLDPKTLNKVWLTHQGCMCEILKCNGHNKYKVPHMGKNKLAREGNLPVCFKVGKGIVEDAKKFMTEGIVNPEEFLPANIQSEFINEDVVNLHE